MTPASGWPSSAPPWPRPSVRANGTDEQVGQWIPAMFGTEDEPKVAAFCSSEPDAGSDVGAMRTRAVYDEATDEWVLDRHQDLGDQRRHRRHPRRDRGRGPGAEGPRARQLRRPAGHEGARAGAEVPQARHPRLAHRGGRARRLPHPGRLPARRPGEARGAAGPRPRGRARAAAPSRRWPPSSAPGPASARRRSGSPGPPTSTRWSTRSSGVQFGRPIIENQAIAFMLADMKTSIDAARLLVWRAAWMARTGQQFTAAEGSMSQAGRRRDRRARDRAGDPDPRRQRLHPRVPGRADGAATPRSTRSSRAPRRSSGWSSRARSPASRSAERPPALADGTAVAATRAHRRSVLLGPDRLHEPRRLADLAISPVEITDHGFARSVPIGGTDASCRRARAGSPAGPAVVWSAPSGAPGHRPGDSGFP